MIEKVGLEIPDELVPMLQNGQLLQTNGILRKAENMEIFKHLKIVNLDSESCWKELGNAISRVIREHKVESVVIVGSVITGSVAIGKHFWKKHNKDKELEEKYNAWINKVINDYIQSAREGNLSMDTIGSCEDALKSLPHITQKVFVELTKEQIVEFTANLRDYPMKLAEVNGCTIRNQESLNDPDNVITCFLNNLAVQKEILATAA